MAWASGGVGGVCFSYEKTNSGGRGLFFLRKTNSEGRDGECSWVCFSNEKQAPGGLFFLWKTNSEGRDEEVRGFVSPTKKTNSGGRGLFFLWKTNPEGRDPYNRFVFSV